MALDTIEHNTSGGSTPPPAYIAGLDLNQRPTSLPQPEYLIYLLIGTL
jgi:hypothetical protein